LKVESIEALEFEDSNGLFFSFFEAKQVFYIYLPSQIPAGTQARYNNIKGKMSMANYGLLGSNVLINILLYLIYSNLIVEAASRIYGDS